VRELKKGIKCSNPVTNRRRAAGTVSPKRVQNSPSLPLREKSSPKKVKLGIQRPSNATKPKACAAALQPLSGPFTSTPKATNKGHAYKGYPSSPWFHHISPIKGVLQIAHPSKKKTDLSPHSENSTAKDFVIKNAAMAEIKENGQRDKYIRDRPHAQCLKVQTVEPVQKQLVSRDDLAFGDGILPSDDGQGWGKTFKHYGGTWTNLPPLQKEREEHLRLYHQQLQQPPFETFLVQYKLQETQVKPELSLTPTEVQSKEGMQLEELDDSDFSEDSFSPVCNQKSMKRRNTDKHSPHSFFLHQREEGTEEEQNGQKRQGLLFKYAIPMQECEADDSWDCSEGSPKTEESIKSAGCSKTPWNLTHDLPIESSPSNTSEKPYCVQEDPASNWKNGNDFLAKATLTPEKDASISLLFPVLKSGSPECTEIDLQQEEKEEFNLDRQAALAGDVKQKALKNRVNHFGSSSCSSEFNAELMAPLKFSLLDYKEMTNTEKVSSNREKSPCVKQMSDRAICGSQNSFEEEGWQCTRSRALADSMLELGGHTCCGGRHCTLLRSPQTEGTWSSSPCCDLKAWCCLLGLGSSKQGLVHSLLFGCHPAETSAAESTGFRVDTERDLFLSNSMCKEYGGGRQGGADVKDNTGNSGKSNSKQGTIVEPVAQEKNADIPEKSYFPGASCSLRVGGTDYTIQSSSQGSSLLLQPKSGLRNEDLSRLEDTCISLFSNEETELLNNKLMQTSYIVETIATDLGFLTKEKEPLPNAKSPAGTSSSSSPSATSELRKREREVLEKAQQAVIEAHQQQLDEVASLCFKEECLINQMPAMDFQSFVTKLDEILVLKSKCIQTMRAQLQVYLASPGSDTSLQIPPPL
ncbi:PREDICTED: kinesin-like protein KIF24, partial [Merops nubicus]|uniref:kinesin-like protein KIF24 n=1 Tax=Merops nubicus TaxID=57421 RepID=UPI0004F04B18